MVRFGQQRLSCSGSTTAPRPQCGQMYGSVPFGPSSEHRRSAAQAFEAKVITPRTLTASLAQDRLHFYTFSPVAAMNLGNPNGAAALRRAGKGGVALRQAVSRNADEFAAGLASVVEGLRRDGVTPLRAIANALNERGMLTRRGGRWQVSNVAGLLHRLGGEENASAGRCARH